MFMMSSYMIIISQHLTFKANKGLLNIFGIFICFVIGFRDVIGPDWYPYIGYYERTLSLSFLEVLQSSDPGYYFLNFLSSFVDGGVYLVNFLSAILFVTGIVAFCKSQSNMWVAISISIPYLIIVVGMGYTRQAIAIGLVLLGLSYLSKERLYLFFVWVLIAAAFHKSAVLMLPLAGLASSKSKILSIIWTSIITLVGGYLFLFSQVDVLLDRYTGDGAYESSGAIFRVFLNVVPAIIYLCFYKKLGYTKKDNIWILLSILAIVCIPLVFLASTATDRVALYIIPLQIYVFSNLHMMFSDSYKRTLVVLGVTIYYMASLLVWLNFAGHIEAWVPYKSVLI